MKISELIKKLEYLEDVYGDLDIRMPNIIGSVIHLDEDTADFYVDTEQGDLIICP